MKPDSNSNMIKNRYVTTNSQKQIQPAPITSKYLNNHSAIMEDACEDLNLDRGSDQKAEQVEGTAYDHRSPLKEPDVIQELKGDSPLEDSLVKKEEAIK